LKTWVDNQTAITALAGCQLFFVGGAPRSGTTWLQLLLDAHPQVSCRGEGFFFKWLAQPLGRTIDERRKALDAKNVQLFRDTGGGYPLPGEDDTETLLGTGILLALERQRAGKACLAIGEKTPENVFLFARLKRLFPNSKFIGLVRDPRDVLTSAWHFFRKSEAGKDEVAAKTKFVREALPSLQQGTRTMLDLCKQYPSDCIIVTYEYMHEATEQAAAQLFRFLGVSDGSEVVAACVARTKFSALAGDRPRGSVKDGAFFRSGMVGSWRSTLTPQMSEMIVRELGWMFPQFGWQE
jgi:hypothetical protein